MPMGDVTIESEAWDTIAAESGLEKGSFESISGDTDGFRLSNCVRKTIPDLRTGWAEAGLVFPFCRPV